jgi:putative PEP-CTERM system TPR-repeat lipoprotein
MLRSRLVFASLLALGVAACSSDPATLSKRHIKSGDGYLAKKQYDDAIVEYRRALQILPQSGEAHYKLAEAYAATNDIINALPEYVRAADRLQDDYKLQLKAGNLLMLAGRFNDAKNRARLVLRADPKSVPALVLLGNSLAGLRNLDEAVDVAKRAVEADPDRPGLHGNLATLQLAKGERELAETAFKKAVEIAGKNTPAPYMALSNFYRSAGRLADAEKQLRIAYEFAPKDVKLNRALGSLLIEANRAPEAEQYIKTSAALDEDVQSRIALADYYLQTQRHADAVRVLDELTKNPKTFALAKIRTAIVQIGAGDRKKAFATVEEILAKNPKDVTAIAFKARLLLADHKLDEAMRTVQHGLDLNARMPEIQYMLGKVKAEQGYLEDARKAFNEALDLEPYGVDASMELALLHRRRGEIDTAISFAERSVKNQPDNLTTRITLVKTLLARSEDYPRAELETKALLERYPAQPAVHALWGNIRILNRDPEGARKAYEAALALDPDNLEAYTGLMALDQGTKRLPALTKRLDDRIAQGTVESGLILLSAKTSILGGDFKHAQQLLEKALASDQGQLDAYVLLGQLYLLQNNVPEAIAEFQKLATLDSKSIPTATMLGILHQYQKNLPEAIKWYEKAVQINPRMAAPAANNLACLYAEGHGNLDQALQYAQYAVSGNPYQPEFHDTLGWIYYKKQMYEQALKPLSEAASMRPNDPILQFHVGQNFAQMGEDAKARKALTLALKLSPNFPGSAEAKKTLSMLVY